MDIKKLDYLYAFEELFVAKCKAAGIPATKWKIQGMWTNAHMSYGLGDTVEVGVQKWFDHVKKHA